MIYTKKDKRELTPFIGKEIVFLKQMDRLKPSAEQSLNDFVSSHPSARQQQKNFIQSIDFAKSLQKIEFDHQLINYVLTSKGWTEQLIEKSDISRWPKTLRWTTEMLIVISLALSIMLLLPIDKISKFNLGGSGQIILAESSPYKEREQEVPGNLTAQIPAQKEPPVEFKDEPQKTNANSSSLPKVPAVEASNVETKISAKKTQGSLFRATIRISNIKAVNPKLIEGLVRLGGRKAGEVPLGWMKEQGSYFHFTIPENKFEDFRKVFSEYGELIINKEDHERVMPEGIVRVIVNVYEIRK